MQLKRDDAGIEIAAGMKRSDLGNALARWFQIEGMPADAKVTITNAGPDRLNITWLIPPLPAGTGATGKGDVIKLLDGTQLMRTSSASTMPTKMPTGQQAVAAAEQAAAAVK